jgi:hypothetical protein
MVLAAVSDGYALGAYRIAGPAYAPLFRPVAPVRGTAGTDGEA